MYSDRSVFVSYQIPAKQSLLRCSFLVTRCHVVVCLGGAPWGRHPWVHAGAWESRSMCRTAARLSVLLLSPKSVSPTFVECVTTKLCAGLQLIQIFLFELWLGALHKCCSSNRAETDLGSVLL